ncbi:GNAT family N-acetyltransferase [Methanosphaera sp. ISO3-F5]|uniref:GNAT family N-acetyltransferase n=1 Tax=Methanosphaera sp. ISO3-F5 TaxID=1452353 RepID=UPI002B25C1C7|nr:GNAT family N-acetyltransferase [Methanosphaera sp. ISO3-F5]WQH63810.1 GNAT family N-acetyltransferase [Methanosphaera sp. ISO3-F5]
MNPEYKTREETDFKIIKNPDNKETLTNFIKQEYPYITQAMKYEEYKIEYEEYDILQELLYDNKVIGILSIEVNNNTIRTLCINEVYILPEYRHNGIFHETLLNLLTQPNMTIAIKNPNRTIIDLLLKYKLAKKLKNNIVLSYIDFIVEDKKIYTNKQLTIKYENNYIKDEKVPTDFYDLNINSCVFIEINNLNDIKKNKAYIIKARLTDSKNERYYNLLKNVDETYIENLKERILNINDEDITFLENVRKRIDEYLDINDILGTENNLNPIFQEKLEEHNLSIEDGFIIRNKVNNALKNNEIIPKSMVIRTLYLLETYNQTDSQLEHYTSKPATEDKCPYCSNNISLMEEVCSKCGYNLLLDNQPQDLIEKITEKMMLTTLPPRLTLKETINNKQQKISNILKEELDYTSYDEDEVYTIQNIISTYQFLKDINEILYFEIYNYDLLNNIQEGSTLHYALKNNLIQEMNDYQYYIKLLEDYLPDRYLKKILSEHNYDIDGDKDDLIYRIEKNISPKDIFGVKYVLTKKGNEYIVNQDYLENYLENLSEFTFYEYYDFYNKNKDKSYDELNREFIEYIKEIALETDNYYKYHDLIRHKINSSDLDQEEFLVLFTMLFIIDINYWINSKNHRKTNKPISVNVLTEFPEIKRLYYQNDIEDIYYKAFNSIMIPSLKNNEDLVKFYLKKSLEYDDIDDVNREIEYNIFVDEYLRRYSI